MIITTGERSMRKKRRHRRCRRRTVRIAPPAALTELRYASSPSLSVPRPSKTVHVRVKRWRLQFLIRPDERPPPSDSHEFLACGFRSTALDAADRRQFIITCCSEQWEIMRLRETSSDMTVLLWRSRQSLTSGHPGEPLPLACVAEEIQ